jgi:hypothetical protein
MPQAVKLDVEQVPMILSPKKFLVSTAWWGHYAILEREEIRKTGATGWRGACTEEAEQDGVIWGAE